MFTATPTAATTTTPPSLFSINAPALAATIKHLPSAPVRQRHRNSAISVSTNFHDSQPLENHHHHHHHHGSGFRLPFPLQGILNIFEKLASSFSCPPALATEEQKSQFGWDSHGFPPNLTVQLNRLSDFKKYKVSNINFLEPKTRAVVDGARESFADVVSLRPGGIYTKKDLVDILDYLSSSPYFEKVEFDAKTNPDGTVDINVPFREMVYASKSMVRCVSVGLLPEEKPIELDPNLMEREQIKVMNIVERRYEKRMGRARACILPKQVQEEISRTLRQELNLRGSLLSRIIAQIHKWYHDNGYNCARVVNLGPPIYFDGSKEIIFEVNEGDITKLAIKFQDKLGNTCQGNTNIKVIKRALPQEVAVGNVFNQRAFEKAMRNINSLNLFSSIDVVPQQDDRTGALSAEILLKEHTDNKWYDVKTDWNIVPGRRGRLPSLDWLRPGATISFANRNIKGLNRSFEGSLTLSNLFDPEDNIYYNFDYTHPYVDGIDNPRDRTFKATCFNTKKRSPVFRGGPGIEDNFPIWVDRKGIKATITEEYTKQSKFTYGLVMEDINTRDEDGLIAVRAQRVSLDGRLRENGPVTTLSGTGNDRFAFLQANLTRDNTRSVNGAMVGARDVFQVDQGVGIGSKFAFFNRAKVSATRFIPLRKVKEGKDNAAPPVLVLHGLYANCVGDLPNHEAFTIGGPHSVRGYSVGEIGASRSKIEVAAEVRVPVKNACVYAFAEHGNDLGSSVGLRNKRRGYGSSYGAGIKFGQLRAEYAVDHNTHKGAFYFHFGDRF